MTLTLSNINSDLFRDYQQSHPWIRFTVDFTDVTPELWILLGEVASKCEHLAQVPVRGETRELLHQIYMARGVLASTAIEGNMMTEDQAVQAVQGSLQVPPSQEYQLPRIQERPPGGKYNLP